MRSTRKAPAAGESFWEEVLRRILGDEADRILRQRLLQILQQTYLAGGTTAAESLGVSPTIAGV